MMATSIAEVASWLKPFPCTYCRKSSTRSGYVETTDGDIQRVWVCDACYEELKTLTASEDVHA